MKRALALLFTAWTLGMIPVAFGFEGIRVTFLAAAPGAGHDGSSVLIEAGDQVILVGCAAGVGEGLRKRGMAPGDVSAIFLTDLAAHHVAGCREVLEADARSGSGLPAPVWGPRGTAALFERLDAQAGVPQDARSVAFDIADNVIYQPEAVTVTAFVAGDRNYGYRIDAYRRTIAVAGAARFSENVVRNTRNAQVLLQELDMPVAAVDDAPDAGSSPEDAGRLFKAAHPYLAVYTNVPASETQVEDVMRRTRRTYPGPVQIARDMLVIEIQNEVQVRNEPSTPN